MFRILSATVILFAGVLLSGCTITTDIDFGRGAFHMRPWHTPPTPIATPGAETTKLGPGKNGGTGIDLPWHIVSLYPTGTESQLENEAVLRDYTISHQQYLEGHLSQHLATDADKFSLDDSLPVIAIGRTVIPLAANAPLPELAVTTPITVYVTGGRDRTAFECKADPSVIWQEVWIGDNPNAAHNVAAYSLPVAGICYMPPNTSSQELGNHAKANNLWIDIAVSDLGSQRFGLSRFGRLSGDPAGDDACRTVCDPVQCNSAAGCFAKYVCSLVCR